MLEAHPLLAVVNETYWLPREYWERAGLTQDGVVTPALFPLLLDSPTFERMGFGETDLRRIAVDGAPSLGVHREPPRRRPALPPS